MHNQNSKKKKLLIMLVIVLPMIGLIGFLTFNSLKKPGSDKDQTQKQQAFNTSLPDANLKESEKNKLEIYMQAQKDSAKLREQLQKDAANKRLFDPGPPDDEIFADEYPPKNSGTVTRKRQPTVVQNEKKVNDRLEKLYEALNSNEQYQNNQPTLREKTEYSSNDQDIARLEKLLAAMQATDTTTDPEMKQLEAMLDKVLDIQHPERVKERMARNEPVPDAKTFAVTTQPVAEQSTDYENGFWGFNHDPAITLGKDILAIPAVVHNDQLLQQGSVIKIRLLQDIFIGENRIPKDNFIFGECSIGDQRLLIRFNSIAYNNSIYPVKLTVYDTDGNEGIYIPGAISRDAAKNGLNQAIQQMQLTTLDPSIGAQATSAGIQAAQNLLRKKVKRVQVTVKAGHKVLLKVTGAQ